MMEQVKVLMDNHCSEKDGNSDEDVSQEITDDMKIQKPFDRAEDCP